MNMPSCDCLTWLVCECMFYRSPSIERLLTSSCQWLVRRGLEGAAACFDDGPVAARPPLKASLVSSDAMVSLAET